MLGLAVRGAELGVPGPCLSMETVHGMFLLWLMTQESAGNYLARPKAKSEYAGQLLLLDRSFLLKLAAAPATMSLPRAPYFA